MLLLKFSIGASSCYRSTVLLVRTQQLKFQWLRPAAIAPRFSLIRMHLLKFEWVLPVATAPGSLGIPQNATNGSVKTTLTAIPSSVAANCGLADDVRSTKTTIAASDSFSAVAPIPVP